LQGVWVVLGIGEWSKGVAQSRLCATPCFLRFLNAFIGFVEYSMGCGKMSTLRHTLKACNGKGLGDVKSVKK